MSENNRKYPRVFLTKGVQEFDKIMGIDVQLPDGTKAGILDISYAGAAILKSSKEPDKYSKGEALVLSLVFGATDSHPLKAEVVRVDEKAIAIRFTELAVSTRLALQKFLKEKLIGVNMNLVSPEFYIKEQKFNFWFHGPNETNIFIWGTKEKILRATIEIDKKVLTIEHGHYFESITKEFLDAPTEDYAYQVNHPSDLNEVERNAPIVSAALSLLGQIKDDSGIIERLLQDILSDKT